MLRKLQSDSPGIEASALISEDGLMIASVLPPSMEESRVVGMTAILLNLGSRGIAAGFRKSSWGRLKAFDCEKTHSPSVGAPEVRGRETRAPSKQSPYK